MGKGVGIPREAIRNNGSGPSQDLTHRNVQDEHGGLEDVEADDFFDQIALRDDDIETDHHEKDDNPVVVEIEKATHDLAFAACERNENGDHDGSDRHKHA